MAQAKTRSSKSGSSGASKPRSSTSKSRSAGKPRSTSRPASAASSRKRSSPTSSNGGSGGSNGQRRNGNGSVKTTALAAVGTAAGLVGGAVLGSRIARRPKRVLGLPVPGTGGGLNGLTKEVRKAGKQLGQLAEEVRTVRKKAEKVGDAVS